MEGLGKIFKGFGIFLVGYIVAVSMYLFIPDLITTLSGIFPSSDLEAISWIICIIVWVILTLVLPVHYIMDGMKELSEGNQGFASGIIGGLLFVFVLFFTVKAWYMVDILYALADTNLIRGLFFVGLALNWLMIQVVAPLYMIFGGTPQ